MKITGRHILWQKRIQHSAFKKNNIHLEREKCFLQLAWKRCDTGSFFITDSPCEASVLSMLAQDEFIQYGNTHSWYFITHDIYEEWALEKLMKKNLQELLVVSNSLNRSDLPSPWGGRSNPGFRVKYQKHIPILNYSLIRLLLKILVPCFLNTVPGFYYVWQVIAGKRRYYLKRIVFLLRIACKEVDSTFQKIIQSSKISINPAYVFTKPKGKGWEVTISFPNDWTSLIKKDDLDIYLPLLKEWVGQHSTGNTTRLAGSFALHFYKDAELNDESHYRTETEKLLLHITLGAVRELKTELTTIAQGLLLGPFNRRDAFDSLREAVLASNNESLPLYCHFTRIDYPNSQPVLVWPRILSSPFCRKYWSGTVLWYQGLCTLWLSSGQCITNAHLLSMDGILS